MQQVNPAQLQVQLPEGVTLPQAQASALAVYGRSLEEVLQEVLADTLHQAQQAAQQGTQQAATRKHLKPR